MGEALVAQNDQPEELQLKYLLCLLFDVRDGHNLTPWIQRVGVATDV